jgi:hypothetical protein
MTTRMIVAAAVLLALGAWATAGRPREAAGEDKEQPKPAPKVVALPEVVAKVPWTLRSVSVKKGVISLSDFGGGPDVTTALIANADGFSVAGVTVNGLTLAADAEISLDGKPAKVGDLKEGMSVSVRLAKDAAKVTKVEAKSVEEGKGGGPLAVWTLKSVDPKKGLATFTNEKLGMTVKDLEITKDTHVTLCEREPFGKATDLAVENLKEGSVVSLEFQFDKKTGKLCLAAIATGEKK